MSRKKKTKTEQNAVPTAAETVTSAPATAVTDPTKQGGPAAGSGSRLNRLWRLYCARVASVDSMRELRGDLKAFRDAYKEAKKALDVFDEELAKESAQ